MDFLIYYGVTFAYKAIKEIHQDDPFKTLDKKYPNLQADGPEHYFVSDITHVKSKQAVHYLSLVTDAYSKKIMGYHLSAESVVKALKKAIKNRMYTNQTIHHSDTGLQYCSMAYQKVLRKANIIPSMTEWIRLLSKCNGRKSKWYS